MSAKTVKWVLAGVMCLYTTVTIPEACAKGSLPFALNCSR